MCAEHVIITVRESSLSVLLVIPLALCTSHFVICHYSKPQVNLTDDIHTPSTGPPHCSKHGHLCKLRIVRKDGENKGRMFYSCPLPPETRCNYFQVSIKLHGLFSNM